MTISILKAVVIGAFLGTALFFMPGLILVFLLLLMATRLFGYRRGMQHRLAFAEKIRTMSDEDYEQFKQQPYGHCRRK